MCDVWKRCRKRERAGNTCKDRERSGRPLVVDDDQIKNLIESNPHYKTREIAEIIDVSQKTIYILGYVSRYEKYEITFYSTQYNVKSNNI